MTRPRLQLHLSTLLIVSLLAAGLVWLNVRTYFVEHHDWINGCRGFPAPFQEWLFHDERSVAWSYSSLTLDFALCVTLLPVAAVAIEWVTRQMKPKPPT
jgi:hypothetical protein